MNPIAMQAADWVSLLVHFMELSMLCVGGAIATAPDMHRFLVQEHGWLTDPQFSASISIAQAAPGPNVLFTALMGWNVGLNAGGFGAAVLGMVLCLGGIMLPSSMLVYLTSHWSHRNRERRGVRAFKQGMAPVVIALLLSTGWILAMGNGGYDLRNWPAWAIALVSTVVVWRTRVHLLWLLGAGAIIGWMGWI
jgi:chromate transporter